MYTVHKTNQQQSSHAEIESAIEIMICHMTHIDSLCTDGFPLYSPGTSNQWTISPGGSWVGGFWGAWWWLRAHITKSVSDQCKASELCQRLLPKIDTDSVNRSLIFWYGASLGDIWFQDMPARRLAQQSMIALAAAYDPKTHCIPLGIDMGGGEKGKQLISIDSLAALIQLFRQDKSREYEDILRSHTDTLITACCDNQGAFHAAAHFNHGNFQPIGQAGAWSRGQAWGMLGLSRAAIQWGEPYLTYAQSACEYWKNSRSEPLPLNRLDNSSGLYDPSASVIASLAMLSLANLVPNGQQWHRYAHQQITAIIRSQYFTGIRSSNHSEKHKANMDSGIFWGSCYKTHPDKEALVETTWGSFLLMAALCILVHRIEPDQI